MTASDLRKVPWLLLGAALVGLGAQADVPMFPVPMTLQSLFIMLVGALLGARWGTASIVVYLAAGAAGLPIFADGASGVEHFVGPTAGYLVGFAVAAAWVGWRCEAGDLAFWRVSAAMLVGHGWILGVGAAWLAVHTGWAAAWTGGVAPFVVGAAAKSVVAAGLAKLWWSREETSR